MELRTSRSRSRAASASSNSFVRCRFLWNSTRSKAYLMRSTRIRNSQTLAPNCRISSSIEKCSIPVPIRHSAEAAALAADAAAGASNFRRWFEDYQCSWQPRHGGILKADKSSSDAGCLAICGQAIKNSLSNLKPSIRSFSHQGYRLKQLGRIRAARGAVFLRASTEGFGRIEISVRIY